MVGLNFSGVLLSRLLPSAAKSVEEAPGWLRRAINMANLKITLVAET